jgi:hypothetical protein
VTEYRTDIQKQFPLDAIGTRYDHYMELKELFSQGVTILQEMNASHKGAADEEKLNKLKAAVEVIERRIDLLSGFDDANKYSSSFALNLRVIDRMRNNETLEGFKSLDPVKLLEERLDKSEGTKADPRDKAKDDSGIS